MHAVVPNVTINDFDAATDFLRSEIIPRVRQAPGFVGGYWVRIDGDSGTLGKAIIAFESEEAARAVADQIQQNPGEAVTVQSVEVGEVVERA